MKTGAFEKKTVSNHQNKIAEVNDIGAGRTILIKPESGMCRDYGNVGWKEKRKT